MATRARSNFSAGTVNILNTSTTTITGVNFPVPAANTYIPITLNPGYFGTTSNTEVIYIGSGGTSTVPSVLARGQEGTSATLVSGTNIPWVAGPLASDFDVYNLTSTGTLSLANGLSVTGGNAIVSNNLTTSGTVSVSGNVTIGGSLTVNGTLTETSTISFPSGSVAYSSIKSYGPWSSYLTSGSYYNLGVAANGQVANVAVSGYNNYLITANWFVNHGSVNTILRYGVGTVDGFGYLTYTGPKVALNIAGALGADNVRPYSYSALFSPGSTASTKAGLGMYVDNNAGGASAGFVMFTVVGIN